MNRLLSYCVVLATAFLVACGGGGGDTILNPGAAPGAGPMVATIELITSSTSLSTDVDRVEKVTITAIAKDQNNALVEGVAMIFSADSGDLLTTQSVTDVNGIATAELTNGADLSNRVITITATDGTVATSTNIAVVGTSISLTGPTALALSDTGNYTAVILDGQGAALIGVTLAVTSANGNSLTPGMNITTLNQGQADVQLSADNAGVDTLTVSALGTSAAISVNVSNDSFAITVPAAGAEINLGVVQPVNANFSMGGAGVGGRTISFTSTRGTLSAATAVTNGAGDASVTISSTIAGPTVITATEAVSGATTSVSFEFVATTPSTMDLQADPFTVPTGGQSVVVAVIRDATGNLVKNQTVLFTITADDTGGALSIASAITDSQGKATTVYTGGGVPGSPNGVTITATVSAFPLVTDTVNLTVAREELDLSIGTGNDIFSPTTASHAQEWNVFVTDAIGNAVQNKDVQVGIRSVTYKEGQLVVGFVGTTEQWIYGPGSPVNCPDEDLSPRDGILQPAEDLNGSGQLEAGNVALVAPVPDTAPFDDPCTTAGTAGVSADVTTNAQGIARVCVFWPQDHSLWLDAQIEARASVQGSEFSAQQVFLLPALAQDISNTNASPPSQFSPFGTDLNCATPPPGLPIIP